MFHPTLFDLPAWLGSVWWLFSAALCAMLLVQVVFWALVVGRLVWYLYRTERKPRPVTTATALPSVSVVICAKNEAANLAAFLPAVLNQIYPTSPDGSSFEVVVVNDASDDETDEVLTELANRYTHLRVITIPHDAVRTLKGKRHALSAGITAARNDFLVLTDADSVPSSPYWVLRMAEHGRGGAVVLGFSPYRASNMGTLGIWIRFEALWTALQYTAFALWGMPYMGVGRNIAYPKHLWQNKKGFENMNQVTSGDDDLFVNAIAHRTAFALCLSQDAWVYSLPKRTWGEYVHQKTRHHSAGVFYRPLHLTVLGLVALSHITFWLGVGMLSLTDLCGVERVMQVLVLCRIVSFYVVFSLLANKLRERSLLLYLPFLDLALVPYLLYFALRSISFPHLPRPTSWK